MVQELEGVKEVAEPRVEAQEPILEKKAKWRYSYVIKQLESLEGNMDAVYRQLCARLIDAEYQSVLVITELRKNVTKQGEVAADLQEKSFTGRAQWYTQLAQGAAGFATPVLVMGLEKVSSYDINKLSNNLKKVHGIVTKENFQSMSTLAQTFQTPFQVLSTMAQQDAQMRQTKHGGEKTGADQLGQQLDQEKNRSKETQEGIRRAQKEQRDSEGQLFAQIARG